MTAKTLTQIKSDIDTAVTTNGTGDIDGADVRTVLNDLADSYDADATTKANAAAATGTAAAAAVATDLDVVENFVLTPTDRDNAATLTHKVLVLASNNANPGSVSLAQLKSLLQSPEFTFPAGQTANISEDASVSAVVGALTHGSAVSFTIDSGNTGGAFAISNAGVITVAAALDRETTASYTLSIIAADTFGVEITEDVVITVDNVAPDLSGYEVTTGSAGTDNGVINSEPTLAQLDSSAEVTQAGTTMEGFVRALAFDGANTTKTAYIDNSADAPSTEFEFSCFVQMDDGGIPVPGVAANAAEDLTMVIDNATVTPSVTPVGDGVYRLVANYTYGVTVNTGWVGIVKYNSNSSRSFRLSGIDVRPIGASTGGLINFVTAAGTITRLASGDQTYSTDYDSLMVSAAATKTDWLTDQDDSDDNPYAGSYFLWSTIGMMLSTGDPKYVDEFLTDAQRSIDSTREDNLGYQSWGPVGSPTSGHPGTSFVEEPGSRCAALLQEVQGAEAIAVGATLIREQANLTPAQKSQADSQLNFLRANFANKWDARGGFVASYVNVMASGSTSSEWDKAIMWSVVLLCLTRQVSNATWEGYLASYVSQIKTRMYDSAVYAGKTPDFGSRMFDNNGKSSDISHMNRVPRGLLWHWVIGGDAVMKTELEGLGKHYFSMLWDGNSAPPAFAQESLGGTSYGVSGYPSYAGWVCCAAADDDSQTPLNHFAANRLIMGGSNNVAAGQAASMAWQQACRAIRGSI